MSFEKVASTANQSTKTIIVTSLNTMFIILVVCVLFYLLQPVLIFQNVVIVEVNFSSYLPCLLHNTKSCVIFGTTLYLHALILSLTTIFACWLIPCFVFVAVIIIVILLVLFKLM